MGIREQHYCCDCVRKKSTSLGDFIIKFVKKKKRVKFSKAAAPKVTVTTTTFNGDSNDNEGVFTKVLVNFSHCVHLNGFFYLSNEHMYCRGDW